MARPAPNAPHGDYAKDREPVLAPPVKRAAPPKTQGTARQEQSQGDARPGVAPSGDDIEDGIWHDIEPARHEADTAERKEPSFAPARQPRAAELGRALVPASASSPDPVLLPGLQGDVLAETTTSLGAGSAFRAAKRRESSIASAIALIGMAILAASLSAAVVLFLF